MIALLREVSAALGDCQLSFVDRAPIDLPRARMQHAGYVQALAELGCGILLLPAQDMLPDAVFVEDVAVVLDELAVITRPGAESRRAERASVAEALARFRTLRQIEAPATLDGGDVLRVGRQLFVGRSMRSNDAGVAELRQLLLPHGYRVQGVDIRGCLHLKSAVTAVDNDLLLLNPDWVDVSVFEGLRTLQVDPSEPHAANALRVGGQLLYPDSSPRTLALLRQAGIRVRSLSLSELQKAEGAVTCCSLLIDELQGVH